MNFNPRSRVGNDPFAKPPISSLNKFQSTFPRGERHSKHYTIFRDQLFQSTFPRGERHGIVFTIYALSIISIHVPAWGTTFKPDSNAGRWVISIHVPAWGTTSRIKTISGLMTISIHVPAWGTTQKLSGVEFDYTKFQSTFPRGERPWSQKVLLIFW